MMEEINNILQRKYNIQPHQINIISGDQIFIHDSMLTIQINEEAIPLPEAMYEYDAHRTAFDNIEVRGSGEPSQRYSMLSNYNKKLSYMLNFSLPASVTCPGQSTWCRQNCYANKNTFVFQDVMQKYLRNFAKSKQENFSELMLGNGNMRTFRGNERKSRKLLRLHVSGDFYDNEYTDKWKEIINQSPDWQFFGYTKSWRVKGMLKKLEEIRDLPNAKLFASTDDKTGKPPTGWQEAAIVGMEQKKEKKGDRFLTCPEQQGTKKSCIDCGFCYRASKGNVRFIIH